MSARVFLKDGSSVLLSAPVTIRIHADDENYIDGVAGDGSINALIPVANCACVQLEG